LASPDEVSGSNDPLFFRRRGHFPKALFCEDPFFIAGGLCFSEALCGGREARCALGFFTRLQTPSSPTGCPGSPPFYKGAPDRPPLKVIFSLQFFSFDGTKVGLPPQGFFLYPPMAVPPSSLFHCSCLFVSPSPPPSRFSFFSTDWHFYWGSS